MQTLPSDFPGLPARTDGNKGFVLHPIRQDRMNRPHIRGIKHDINDVQRAGFEICVPLSPTQDKDIPHADRKGAATKRHQTRTTVNDDNFPEFVPVTGISRMVCGAEDRERTTVMLRKVGPVQDWQTMITRTARSPYPRRGCAFQ